MIISTISLMNLSFSFAVAYLVMSSSAWTTLFNVGDKKSFQKIVVPKNCHTKSGMVMYVRSDFVMSRDLSCQRFLVDSFGHSVAFMREYEALGCILCIGLLAKETSGYCVSHHTLLQKFRVTSIALT